MDIHYQKHLKTLYFTYYVQCDISVPNHINGVRFTEFPAKALMELISKALENQNKVLTNGAHIEKQCILLTIFSAMLPLQISPK